MPSILFHELVGYKFAKKYKKYDLPNFYLGVMIPDAVNAYGFASREKRWEAHYRDEDLEKWKNKILEFYKENCTKYEHAYLVGYIIHVLTDILCDEIYSKEIYPELLKKGYDYHTSYKQYEEAIVKLENSNVNQIWWKYVKTNIRQGEKIEINNINKKSIEDWIDYIINEYQNRTYEEVGFIKEEFAIEVLNKIEKILKEEKIL